MCEFCNEEIKKPEKMYGAHIEKSENGYRLVVPEPLSLDYYIVSLPAGGHGFMYIDYCPKCGRRLNNV